MDKLDKGQDGGFLPLLLGSLAAPLIAPLAGNLIKGIAGKGLQTGPPGARVYRRKKINFQE